MISRKHQAWIQHRYPITRCLSSRTLSCTCEEAAATSWPESLMVMKYLPISVARTQKKKQSLPDCTITCMPTHEISADKADFFQSHVQLLCRWGGEKPRTYPPAPPRRSGINYCPFVPCSPPPQGGGGFVERGRVVFVRVRPYNRTRQMGTWVSLRWATCVRVRERTGPPWLPL